MIEDYDNKNINTIRNNVTRKLHKLDLKKYNNELIIKEVAKILDGNLKKD